jgi:hypothetical protein
LKIKDWSKKILWFVLGAVTIGSLSHIYTSYAQNQFVKLVMRIGEERILEDGLKVGLKKGEGDFIIVTLSKVNSSTSLRASTTSKKLKLGTYTFEGTETITSSVRFSSPSHQIVRIKIESIDANGNVKAELDRASDKGQLQGEIDANGNLLLEGSYINTSGLTCKFTLKATAQGDTLNNGKYLNVSSAFETRGTFSLAKFEDDF